MFALCGRTKSQIFDAKHNNSSIIHICVYFVEIRLFNIPFSV